MYKNQVKKNYKQGFNHVVQSKNLTVRHLLFFFREATYSENDFVLITSNPNKGCSAMVGTGYKMLNQFRFDKHRHSQYLNLAQNCYSLSTILHELFHTLGVLHTHARNDRDQHVTIHWENIRPDQQFNYCKENSGQTSSYGVEYDAKSFMHYTAFNAFAIDMSKPTISSKVKNNCIKSYLKGFFQI